MDKISGDINTYYGAPGLFEYMLVVCPGKEVHKKIMEEKCQFFRNYGHAMAIQTRPQVTISNFLAWDHMENTIIRWLQNIAREQKSFRVFLNNYSGFPSHSVYIRIQDSEGLRDLNYRLKAIAPYIKESRWPAARFMHYPNISLAPQLSAELYESAIRDYSGKDFNASFDVTELVLLRRQHPFDKCKQVGVFRMQPVSEQLNQVL
jgi:hypothetical protein